eukprot:364502-Chlamydomonas_euryale.AAC.11
MRSLRSRPAWKLLPSSATARPPCWAASPPPPAAPCACVWTCGPRGGTAGSGCAAAASASPERKPRPSCKALHSHAGTASVAAVVGCNGASAGGGRNAAGPPG